LKENKIEAFFEKLMIKTRPHLKFDGWSVIEYDEINGPSFISLSRKYKKYDLESIERKISNSQSTLFDTVLKTRNWKYVADPFKLNVWMPGSRIRSWIGVPLMFDNEVFGVLNIDYFKPKRLTFKDKLFLNSFQKNFSIYASNFKELKSLFLQKYIDHLTGLKNRHFIEEYFEKNNRDRIAIIFCDLNKFKAVNDTYGHRIGDEVIKIVARRIRNILKSTDEIVRYGGDEFIVLTKNIENVETIKLRIKNAIKKYDIIIEGKRIKLGISCGHAIYPDESTDFCEIMHLADLRMYSDKGER
jgi:diguanylate cyclase (GGDEF)-like protein